MARPDVYISVRLISSSVANPSVISAPKHGLTNGQTVTIAGHTGSTPDINGSHVATVINADSFSIPVNVTVGGTLGRVEAERDVLTESIYIEQTINGVDRFSFNVSSEDGSFVIDIASIVRLVENGLDIFHGTVEEAQERWLESADYAGLAWQIHCLDFTQCTLFRFVRETIPAGTGKEQLQYIVDNYLDDYGISLSGLQADGIAHEAIIGNGRSVREVIEEIVEAENWIWDISYAKVLRAYSPGDISAPSNITDDDGKILATESDPSIEARPLQNKNAANRIIVRYGNGSVLASQTVIGDGVATQFELDPADPAYWPGQVRRGGAITSSATNEVITTGINHQMVPGTGPAFIKIQGHVGSTPNINNANYYRCTVLSSTTFRLDSLLGAPVNITVGGTGGTWEEKVPIGPYQPTLGSASFYGLQWDPITHTIYMRPGYGPLPLNNTLTLIYMKQYPLELVVEDLADIALRGPRERYLELPNVFDTATAQALGEAALATGLLTATQIIFSTYEQGWFPGMTFTLTNAARRFSAVDVFISDVQIVDTGRDDGLLKRTINGIASSRYAGNYAQLYRDWLQAGSSFTAAATGVTEIDGGTAIAAANDREILYSRAGVIAGSPYNLFDYDALGDDYGAEVLPARVAIGVEDENQMVLALWNETAGKSLASTFWMLDTTGEVLWENESHLSIVADGVLDLSGASIHMTTDTGQKIDLEQLTGTRGLMLTIHRRTSNFTAPDIQGFKDTGFTYLVDTTSGDVTASLKALSDDEVSYEYATGFDYGRLLCFKNIGSNDLILDANSAETITYGASSATTFTVGPGESCFLHPYNRTGTPTWHVLFFDGGTGGGSGTPGGSDGQIQYNNGGAFGGDAALTWDDTDKILTIDIGAGQNSPFISMGGSGGIVAFQHSGPENNNIQFGIVTNVSNDWIAAVDNAAYLWVSSNAVPPAMGMEMVVEPAGTLAFTDGRGFYMNSLGRFVVYQYGGLGMGAIPGCGVEVQNNDSGDGAAGFFTFVERDGTTRRYIWWDGGVMYWGNDAPTEDDSIPHTGTPFSTTMPGPIQLLTSDPGAPADDTIWFKRTGAGPYTISANVRIGGVTSSINIGST